MGVLQIELEQTVKKLYDDDGIIFKIMNAKNFKFSILKFDIVKYSVDFIP